MADKQGSSLADRAQEEKGEEKGKDIPKPGPLASLLVATPL